MGQLLTLWVVMLLIFVVPYSNIRRYLLGDSRELESIPRIQLVATTCVSLAIIGGMCWLAMRLVGVDLFRPWRPNAIDLFGGAALLCVAFAARTGLLAWLRDDPRRSKISVVPTTWPQLPSWILVSACAGFFEELAYRGTLFFIVEWFTGNQWVALGVCSLAFGLAHARQGWRSALFIAVFATGLQCLVMTTGSLYAAILVHGLYDLTVGIAHIVSESLRPSSAVTGEANAESAIFAV